MGLNALGYLKSLFMLLLFVSISITSIYPESDFGDFSDVASMFLFCLVMVFDGAGRFMRHALQNAALRELALLRKVRNDLSAYTEKSESRTKIVEASTDASDDFDVLYKRAYGSYPNHYWMKYLDPDIAKGRA